jgi:hypothetical protein
MDSTGYFSAVSDYGNYAYQWHAHGAEDFRKFVAGLEDSWDYLAGKLGGYRLTHVLDVEATAAHLKKELLTQRNTKALKKVTAREEWSQLESLESGDISLEEWRRNTLVFQYDIDCVRYRVDSDLERFCKRLVPRLAKLIRAELGAASPQTPETPSNPTGPGTRVYT